jgi:PKD repeat protein/photosystem II stability/assembly factor-like uncharacterized protein
MLLVAVLFTSPLLSQDWVSMMQDPNVNFFEVQKAFNQYAENYKASYRQIHGTEPAKIPGYKQYKRWEWFMQPRVSPTGERFNPAAVWQEMEKYKKNYGKFSAGAWTEMGPTTNSNLYGIGRVNAIRVHPTNPNTLYVCAPSGGLWISTNGGTSWTTNTDQLPQVIGCSDVAFDPVNPNIMYMATGDRDAGDNYSVGLLKSTDGAQTWNPTGLSFSLANYKRISKVLVDPTNGNNILVSTTSGIYRSTDAAVTFSLVQSGSFMDMEFMPGNPSTVYACGTSFYRSTNGGVTWTQITSGLPAASSLSRMAIAVTPANANYVYLVAMAANTYDIVGFYKSTNGGTSFTNPSAPSIGNQGWYDLCIAANPTNVQEVMLGGQTEFLKSTNGGTSWSQIATTTHVDYHDVMYTSSTTVYLASDGGVWKSTNNGSTWSNLSNTLAIMQFYGFGHSATTANLLIAGAQDNGTSLYNGSWGATLGGDGMHAFISWNNNNNMWGEQYNGQLNRSTNGGASWSSATSGITETGPWDTYWMEDPVTPNKLYAGFQNVWISTNGGVSWTKPGNVAGTSTVTITTIGVSPANPQVIWTSKGGTLYKTTNGGTTWTAIPTSSGLPSGTITCIACHNTDANKAWVTFSGFANSIKVFETSNQGTSWTNLSASLPNIPVNCIVNDKNGNDALYIGTDAGVFYKDATMTVWQPFSTGLPNVVVTQLQIFYGTPNKIRASTYGRGMWESTLYQPGSYAPVANFGATPQIGCPGLGVQFTDYSAGQPTSWSWSFPGGNPSSSTQQNPFVAYNTPGTYNVSLTVSNANGTDSKTVNGYITVNSSPYPAPTASGVNFCAPNTVTLTATPAAPGTVRWWNQPAGGNILATGNTFTTPTLTTTTTYYVDESFPSAGIDFVGAPDKSMGAGSNFTANDIRGLYFDVLQPVVINSVDVYSYTAGNRTIEILDANGNLVTDTTVYVPANPNVLTTVTINRTVYAGNNYFIKFRGLVDCWRNSSGASYPYTSSAVNITGSNATPDYYYFFYNWQYTVITCNTGRNPVTATDTCLIGVNDLFTSNYLVLYPNPNSGVFSVSFYVANVDNYTLKVANALGQTVYEKKLNNFSGAYSEKIDIASYRKGVYLLSVTNSKNQTVKKVVVY